MFVHLVDASFGVWASETQNTMESWKDADLNFVKKIGFVFIVSGQHC
jgi:hypothetical protein